VSLPMLLGPTPLSSRKRSAYRGLVNNQRILFLEVPPSLQGDLKDFSGEGFVVDPEILLPVELPPGEEVLDPEILSWEMIISGMIRVLSECRRGGEEAPFGLVQPPWLGYYRRFILRVKPDIYGEFLGAAVLKGRNGDPEMALEILRCLEGIFPGDRGILLHRALILEEAASADAPGDPDPGEGPEVFPVEDPREGKDRLEEARASYEELLSLEPPFPEALFQGGLFFLKEGNYRRALGCFRDFLPLAEDDERRDQALELIRRIEEPGLGEESLQEAKDLIRVGREEEALPSIREFLENHPEQGEGWFVLGWALRKLGRWEDGAAVLRKSLELRGSHPSGPGAVNTRHELALCLIETGDFPAARKELEKALEEEPENRKLISTLGVLARRRGDDDEAAAFFRVVR